MGAMIGMFSQITRLAFSRAAAFFYAVAVGVVANIVIAHLTPDTHPAPADSHPPAAKAGAPIAMAPIAPRPPEPAKPVEVSAPAVAPAPSAAPPANANVVPPMLPTAARVAEPSLAATSLPGPAQMTAPPLKPASLATPPSVEPKLEPEKPAANVETAARDPASAPIPLLPQSDPPAVADPPPPAPKPGPGSGGLY
jgi:hypothetical protein